MPSKAVFAQEGFKHCIFQVRKLEVLCNLSNKNKGIATAADLLALGQGTKVVKLETCGWEVKIKKAKVGELSDILHAVGDSAMDQFVFLTFRCLVEPQMKIDEIKELPAPVLVEIGTHIAKFSGLDKSSVEKMRNLLEVESTGQSS